MACSVIKAKNRKVCPGSMNNRIIIQNRTIVAPRDGEVDIIEAFSTNTTVWAMIETRQGVEIFDGTNVLLGVATHYFYIRHIDGLTSESWIQFKSKYFDILDIQNFEERDEFMLLRCAERGTTNNASNYA